MLGRNESRAAAARLPAPVFGRWIGRCFSKGLKLGIRGRRSICSQLAVSTTGWGGGGVERNERREEVMLVGSYSGAGERAMARMARIARRRGRLRGPSVIIAGKMQMRIQMQIHG